MGFDPSTPINRSTRIIRGLGANGVTQASQLLMRLAEVPVLLLLWGAAGYGEWILIAALPTAISFSDGGFTKTARREMAMRAGRGDAAGIAAIFQSTWALLLVLSAAMLLLLALLLPYLPLVQWLKLTSIDSGRLTLALLALAIQVLVYFQCGLLHGALTSLGRYALGELLIALSAVLCFSGVMAGAALGGGIEDAALGSLLGQVVGYVAMLGVYARQPGAPAYGFSKATSQVIKALVLPSVSNLAFPLAEAINAQGSRIVIGLTLGPTALAVFATTRTLCRVAAQPIMSIARTIEPELSLAFGSGSRELARHMFIRASGAALWLSIVMAAVVVCLGPFVYPMWSGGKLVLNYPTLLILSVGSVVNVLWGIALTVPCSINRHTSLTLRFVGGYGLASAAIIYLFTSHGLAMPGAALGLLAGDALAAAAIIPVALRVAGTGVTDWLAGTVRPPLPEMFAMLPRRRSNA